MAKYRYSTCKQEGGDDGFCYAIRSLSGRLVVNGLMRREADAYRREFDRDVAAGKRHCQTLKLIEGGDFQP